MIESPGVLQFYNVDLLYHSWNGTAMPEGGPGGFFPLSPFPANV